MNHKTSEKPPCPSCQQALSKHNELKKKIAQYMFTNQQLNISHNQAIQSYTSVYNLIDRDSTRKIKDEKIYEQYQATFSRIFKNDLREFCKKVRNLLIESKGMGGPDNQLVLYYQWFVKYNRFLFWARITFQIIQKNHKVYNRSSLYHEGLIVFKQEIMEPLYDNLFKLITQNLEAFKEGRLQQYFQLQFIIRTIGMCGFSKFKSVILEKNQLEQYQFNSKNSETKQKSQVQYETNFFHKNFTPRMIAFLEEKYKAISEQMMKLSTPQYVEKAHELLQKQQKAAQYFYPHQEVKGHIIRSVQQIIIINYAQTLILNEKTGLVALYQAEDLESLKGLYKLLKRTSQQKLYSHHFQAYIQKKIGQILGALTPEQEKQSKRETVKEIVESIYYLFIKMEKVVNYIYSAIKDPYDLILHESLKIAFQSACNKNSTVCNFIVYYSDNILKKEDKDSENNTAQLTIKLSKMIKFLYSLDHFLKIYQRMLGVRMLYDTYKNRNAELEIINLLKNQVGVSSMNKINLMIQDFKFSEQFNTQMHEKIRKKIPFVLQVMMLTSGSWQINDPKNKNNLVPPQLMPAVSLYEQHYNAMYPGRQITWIFNFGRSVVMVKFNENRYILYLNNYQLLILLCLQRRSFKGLKISDLIGQIKPEDEPGFIASISMLTKKGIIKKSGNSPKIESKNEIVEFNSGFKSKVPKVGCFEVPRFTDKVSNVNSQITADRAILIQACIVKLMKTKRVLHYNEIIREVTKMCTTFKAEISMVKNQIEMCIHKQFLERDQRDLNTLIYKP